MKVTNITWPFYLCFSPLQFVKTNKTHSNYKTVIWQLKRGPALKSNAKWRVMLSMMVHTGFGWRTIIGLREKVLLPLSFTAQITPYVLSVQTLQTEWRISALHIQVGLSPQRSRSAAFRSATWTKRTAETILSDMLEILLTNGLLKMWESQLKVSTMIRMLKAVSRKCKAIKWVMQTSKDELVRRQKWLHRFIWDLITWWI